MKGRVGAVVCSAMFAFAASAANAERGDVTNGEKIYQTWCAACHAAGMGNPGMALKPGADALQAKYKGKLSAILSERTDLTPEFVAVFVRQGISVMPFFRKTEISDRELADLGAYLSRNNKNP